MLRLFLQLVALLVEMSRKAVEVVSLLTAGLLHKKIIISTIHSSQDDVTMLSPSVMVCQRLVPWQSMVWLLPSSAKSKFSWAYYQ